jgi:hypothetical protein
MEPIYSHKICLQSSKPSHAYPIIRLPRDYKALAGKKAQIFQMEQKGQLVFVVQVDKSVDKPHPSEDTIGQRLSALESQIAELKNIILEKLGESDSKKENQRPRARFEPASWHHGGHGTMYDFAE